MHARMNTCIHACMHTCILARMHTCSYACMHAHMLACIHACMHACILARMHTCAYACMHAHMLVCLHAHMHACLHAWMLACIHTCLHACMHGSLHACMHTYMLACLHACMHTYILACIYACIHARMHKQWLSPPQLPRIFASNPPHPADTLTRMHAHMLACTCGHRQATAGANGGFHHRSFTETHARPHPHRMHVAHTSYVNMRVHISSPRFRMRNKIACRMKSRFVACIYYARFHEIL